MVAGEGVFAVEGSDVIVLVTVEIIVSLVALHALRNANNPVTNPPIANPALLMNSLLESSDRLSFSVIVTRCTLFTSKYLMLGLCKTICLIFLAYFSIVPLGIKSLPAKPG